LVKPREEICVRTRQDDQNSPSKRKSYGRAFLDGYKPAILVEKDNPNLHLVKGYPSYEYDEKFMLFFQSEKEREKFVNKVKYVEKDTYEKCCLLGLTLGFPKKSVEFFAKNDQIERETGVLPNRDVSIGMEWAGISFATHIDYVEHEARWLWETYQHPKAIENPLFLWTVETSYLEVPYGDFEKLAEARDYIRKKRGLISNTYEKIKR